MITSTNQESQRTEQINKSLYYFFDDIVRIKFYIREALAQLLAQDTMNDIFPEGGDIDYCNFVQPVIEKLTNIWQEKPTYIINGGDENVTETENTDNNFDIEMNFNKLNYYVEIHRLAALMRLLNTVCVHIAYRKDDEGNEYIQFIPFTYLDYSEKKFGIEFDENCNVASYWYLVGDERHIWTKETKTIEKNGKKEELRHGYGFLPLVVMQHRKSEYKDISDFWGQPANQLVNGNNMVNYFINLRNYQASFSGFDVVLIKGLDETMQEKRGAGTQAVGEIKINPSNPIKTENDQAGIDIAGLQMYYEGYNGIIESEIACIMQSLDLPPDSFSVNAKNSKSGLALVFESMAMNKPLLSFQTVFEKYESEILWKLNNIFKVNKSTNFVYTEIATADDIEIMYGSISPMKTDEEILNNIKTRIDSGILSPVEAIMENEGVTEEVATEKFNKIVEQRGRLTNAGFINGDVGL